MDDGRLTGRDRASFERHASGCAVCGRERAAVDSLRRAMAAATPPPRTPLERRRLRSALLFRAATVGASSTRRRLVPRAVTLGGILTALIIAGFVSTVSLEVASRNQTVIHPAPEPSSAMAPVEPAVPATQPQVVAAEPPVAEQPSLRAPPPHSQAKQAGIAFDEAVASFKSGSYDEAERQLERFTRRFPGDPRAEDATYLRAVAAWRLGQHERAAALARDYLDAYPTGLRRPEAQSIAEARAQQEPVSGRDDASPRRRTHHLR